MNEKGIIAMLMLKRIDKEIAIIETLDNNNLLTQKELNECISILKETDMNNKYSVFNDEIEQMQFNLKISDVNRSQKLETLGEKMNLNTMIEIIECGFIDEDEEEIETLLN